MTYAMGGQLTTSVPPSIVVSGPGINDPPARHLVDADRMATAGLLSAVYNGRLCSCKQSWQMLPCVGLCLLVVL